MFPNDRQKILDALGEGMDDTQKARLKEGFDYIVDLNIPNWDGRILRVVFLPMWTRTVTERHRMDIAPLRYVDILINSVNQDIVLDHTCPNNLGLAGVPGTWRGTADEEAEFWSVATSHYMKLIDLIPA